ncbi:MAG: xylanase/chitin deacetylase [Paenibacillus sp.]|jgi:peptidoglycan-N-acetylmuramic acid deacetylase|nr:xylanase/chitin deacetylase [Paenibacillus sp.]
MRTTRTSKTLIAVAFAAVALLAACSDDSQETADGAKSGPVKPAETQVQKPADPKPTPPSDTGTAKEPAAATDKPSEEVKKEPEVTSAPPPAVTQPQPQPQTVAAQTYQPPRVPTANDKKSIDWYYMKQGKGKVPNFPAETKQMGQEKVVWVGTGKKVYLTIDMGGELLDYKTLLKALKDNQVKATFFVTGYNLKNNPDYIKLLLSEGHTIGNHTMTHRDFTTLTDAQVKQEVADFEKLYKDITGLEPTKYFRFPYGTYSFHLLDMFSEMGYTSYFWSTAMKDWEPRKNGADDAYNDIIGNLHDGNVILMHHASKENIEAMDRILKEIRSEGYAFGTLDELQK